MPIHLDDIDVLPEIAGLKSAVIVPCNMCPAVTLAVREDKPFIQLFRSFLKSTSFSQHIKALQSRLEENGVKTTVFESNVPHQWFMCMWSSGRREKLRKYVKQYEAIIVLGCDTATETVRDSVKATDCKVIEGMEVTGFMNAKLRFHFPCNVSLDDCKMVPIPRPKEDSDARDSGIPRN